MRRRFCVLLCLPLLLLLSAATRARAQGNLLRNADAYEGTTYWRAFGNATVEEGAGGGHVFTLREGGYFIQHARVPDEAAGQYAVFVGEAMCEGCDAKERRGFPNLYGYMMDPGTTHEGGRIYAYVATSGMSYRAGINGWQRLSGIQRVPVGTGTVAFFLRQSIQPRDTSVRQVARFRNLGLYVFPSREAAQAFVSGATTTPADAVAATKRVAEMASALEPGWESMPGARAAETSKTAACAGASLKSLALGGVRLGMSVEEVLASLPGSERDATALHMLARSKDAPNSHGYSHAFVDASYSRDPRLSGVEKYWVKFLDGRLYAVMVIYRGAHWPGVDSFVGGMSGALGLPPAEQWERGGGGSDLRYLICDDVELRFYAAPGTNPNTDSILLADRKAERTLAERKTKAKEAATR